VRWMDLSKDMERENSQGTCLKLSIMMKVETIGDSVSHFHSAVCEQNRQLIQPFKGHRMNSSHTPDTGLGSALSFGMMHLLLEAVSCRKPCHCHSTHVRSHGSNAAIFLGGFELRALHFTGKHSTT
jgi:hypothetical protein